MGAQFAKKSEAPTRASPAPARSSSGKCYTCLLAARTCLVMASPGCLCSGTIKVGAIVSSLTKRRQHFCAKLLHNARQDILPALHIRSGSHAVHAIQQPVNLLQAPPGLPPLVEASSTMQLGPSLQRSLRPLQGLPPQGLPPKGPPLQGLPPLVEGSLTTQWALSLQRSRKPPPGLPLHPSRLHPLPQASFRLCCCLTMQCMTTYKTLVC